MAYIKKKPATFTANALNKIFAFDISANTIHSVEFVIFCTNFFIIFKVCFPKFKDLFGISKFMGKLFYKA